MVVSSPETRSTQILVVEDEKEIRELISLLLQRQGHQVQSCGSVIEALDLLKKTNFDLVVLDWMLPQLSGLDFLKMRPRLPVLMLTAKAEPQDIVQGLEAGADDYLTKPFEPSVLLARIKALLRRAKPMSPSDIVRMGELSLNLNTYEAKCGDEAIHLTPSEFKILSEMATQQGRVLTREHLVSVVQGDGITVTTRTIDTHVFGLRKKLGTCAELIETIRGVGYRVKTE